ncbi:hypothetical protein KOR42_31780 [Thalassoglobus neptunius]|uniref:Uncharacterized protein n=1 Tax=Thalassoglobus neptunius TaxID=1938619 RepID=A0A5C5WPN7_9PLAN|nr:hypothetical protein [Thalassoglobus neptunius]TWT52081.1 hypothetical protein KOR42_31780 [Thalassoglobus neptunius]
MKFETEKSPAPYLNRKDQYRLMGLCGMLLLIVISIDFTSRAENWAWFFSIGQEADVSELKKLDLEDLDFRIEDPNQTPLAQDEFRVPKEADLEPPADNLQLDVSQIPKELLEDVQDRRVGLLRTEEPAMDIVLKRAQVLSEEELEAAATENPGFRVVFTDSEKHRGQLLRVDGTLWRLQRYPYGDPESEDDDLWQAWIFTADSANNPWVVFLTEKPESLTPAEQIDEPVTVVGYFFKNYGYATELGLHIAPMLIAKTMKLVEVEQVPQDKNDNLGRYIFGFLMGIGLLFGIMIWRFTVSDRRYQSGRLAKIAESTHDASPETISALDTIETHDPNQLSISGSDQSDRDDETNI